MYDIVTDLKLPVIMALWVHVLVY